MLKKKSNKGLIATDKLIVIIIVILVVVSVLIFVFKADILRYMRNLPVFSILISNGNSNGNSNTIIPENCIIVASIGKPEGGERFISVSNEKTKLYWNMDNKKIMLYQSLGIDLFSEDIEVGLLENEQIKIENVLLDETSKSYKEFKEKGLPDVETLKILDGSKYFQDESIFCKEKETIIKPPVEVTKEDLVKIMEYYKINKIKNFQGINLNCNCGVNSIKYANSIMTYSQQNSINNPLLILAMMVQESLCNSTAFSGSSVGLMQIYLGHCDNYAELIDDKVKCKNQLISDADLNIDIGTRILRDMYNQWGSKNTKFSKACSTSYKDKYYTGWDAALRGYNGWGCGLDDNGNKLFKQDYYVEDVKTIYETLKKGVPS